MKIAVCDDQQPFLYQLRDMLNEIKFVKQIELFSNIDSFLRILREGEYYDVILMDIDWRQERNGIDFGEELLGVSPTSTVIYMTAYGASYAEHVFLKPSNLGGFLMKPVKPELLEKSLKRTEEQQRRSEERLVVKSRGNILALPYEDILYLENQLHKVRIITRQKEYFCSETLENVKTRMGEEFLSCHKSYVINMDYVLEFHGSEVILMVPGEKGTHPVPVSKARCNEAKERYFKYISDKM